MTFVFKPASRKQSKLRLALVGVSGSGKTWTALKLARVLGKRIAVIDSEHGSASLYAGDVADFDALDLESYAPRTYVQAINAAEAAGYDVIIVDSLSHAWAGKDGALEMVDKAAKRSQSGNSYTAWRDVTPEHNALVDAMISCKAHLIVTMRAKTVHELVEDSRGKKVPKKIGLAPIQREGLDYEFTLVAEMDLEHNFVVSKSRCTTLDGAVINRPDERVAETLLEWLNTGAAFVPKGVDEYGLTMPKLGPCPRFKTGPDTGKLWSEIPGGKLAAIVEKHGAEFNPLQVEWGTYLLARRAKRKEREAQEKERDAAEAALSQSENTSSEGGGWVAGDEPQAQQQ